MNIIHTEYMNELVFEINISQSIYNLSHKTVLARSFCFSF